MAIGTTFKLKRDTSANWSAHDATSIPADGEPVVDTDTGAFKIGDGTSKFSELPNIRKQFQNVITVAKTGKPGTADVDVNWTAIV